jgi:hypothetical protein
MDRVRLRGRRRHRRHQKVQPWKPSVVTRLVAPGGNSARSCGLPLGAGVVGLGLGGLERVSVRTVREWRQKGTGRPTAS